MRGILFVIALLYSLYRFNPAYAGNIVPEQHKDGAWQVQPRVCGEYEFGNHGNEPCAGSTPRMRGILHEESLMNFGSRFNPAYAGNIHAPKNPL